MCNAHRITPRNAGSLLFDCLKATLLLGALVAGAAAISHAAHAAGPGVLEGDTDLKAEDFQRGNGTCTEAVEGGLRCSARKGDIDIAADYNAAGELVTLTLFEPPTAENTPAYTVGQFGKPTIERQKDGDTEYLWTEGGAILTVRFGKSKVASTYTPIR